MNYYTNGLPQGLLASKCETKISWLQISDNVDSKWLCLPTVGCS